MASNTITLVIADDQQSLLDSDLTGEYKLRWGSPPEVLGLLLKELFLAQPEDVLSWIHGAVWRLHTQGSPAPVTASPSPSVSTHIAPPLVCEVDMHSDGEELGILSDPASSCGELMMAGRSSVTNASNSYSSVNPLPAHRTSLASTASVQSNFFKHFTCDGLPFATYTSLRGSQCAVDLHHVNTFMDVVFVACVLYEVWAVPFWTIFVPCNEYGLGVVGTAVLAAYCSMLLMHVAQSLHAHDLCAKCWVWFDLIAVATDVARVALGYDEFQLLAIGKVMRFVHFLHLGQVVWYSAKCLEVIVQSTFFLRLSLMHVVLLFFAHVHTVIWVCLHNPWSSPSSPEEAFGQYLNTFWLACNSLTFGSDMPAYTHGQEVLGILSATMRATMLVMGVVWLWGKKLLSNLEGAKSEKQHEAMLSYLQLRSVSLSLRMRAKMCIEEASRQVGRTPAYKSPAWASIPNALRQEICESLWMPRLMTLGVIREIVEMHPLLGKELCMTVREEVSPREARLFTKGETSHEAFFILDGTLEVQYGEENARDQRCGPGMWVGEQALVNPELLRMQTIVCLTRAELMVVSACEFQTQLSKLGLTEDFKALIYRKLWRGLCGRCGAFGKHFSHNCPMRTNKRRALPKHVFAKQSVVMPEGDIGTCANGLSLFLSSNKLDRLEVPMRKCGINSLHDISPTSIQRLLNDPAVTMTGVEVDILSDARVEKFKETLQETIERDIGQLLAQTNRSQHLVFISHYKAEAGTEASLMQTGLEVLIQNDLNNPGHDLARPVFIDTEDLRDLRDLGEHVRKSHNLIILLTKGVFTRPWCLVEIAAAVSAGVRLVPVEIQRRDMAFEYPDEEYYQRILVGQEFDDGTRIILGSEGIDLPTIVSILRQVFKRIALPYSPHKTAMVREAELKDILKQCRLRKNPELARRPPKGEGSVLARDGTMNSKSSVSAATSHSMSTAGSQKLAAHPDNSPSEGPQ